MARGWRSQAGESSKSGAKKGVKGNSDVPDVFMDMVNEVMGVSQPSSSRNGEREEERTPKRRKVGQGWRRNVKEEEERLAREEEERKRKEEEERRKREPPTPVEKVMEEVEEEEEEEDDDEDMDWEDVDLAKTMASEAALAAGGDLNLVLADPESLRKGQKQVRRITAVERKIRLEVHKLHLLCLSSHVETRNNWVEDPTIQAIVSTHMAPRVREALHPPIEKSQQERSRIFIDGLTRAAKIWRNHFTVTGPGLSLPRWQDSAEGVKGLLKKVQMNKFSKADFKATAEGMKGDSDAGAQLFCALLRGAGVTTRLVCSLQVLLIGFASKPEPESEKKKKVEQNYPVYWVEAWNIASQKWIPVDPLVTHTINQPAKLEPPQSDPQNLLAYALAFEEDGSARDVTRRYAKAFNAKTRKLRVQDTKGGEKWYLKALRHFEREEDEDRDQLEAAEFSRIELEEGIPKSVQDMKDHPLFALERHLKRNEVLWPRRKVATITTGVGKQKVVEEVFRRKDVQVVRSPEQWYRLGRIVNVEDLQTPMKMVSARKKPPVASSKRRRRDSSSDSEIDLTLAPAPAAEIPLYGEWQTQVYVPPPILDGMVPKNAFGNLDIFVSSMIPLGGTHIPHPLASKACKLLQVDFADAVTGFNFVPRAPVTPVVKGVVVPEESAEGVWEVIGGLAKEEEEEREAEKELEALMAWKRFLVKLRIKERAGQYFGDEAQEEEVERGMEEVERGMEEEGRRKKGKEEGMEGGFINSDEEEEEEVPKPRASKRSNGKKPATQGGFLPSDDDEGKSKAPKPEPPRKSIFESDPTGPEELDYGGGGFILSDDEEMEAVPPSTTASAAPAANKASESTDDYGGGGFLPSDDEEPGSSKAGLSMKGANDDYGGGGFLPSDDEEMAPAPAPAPAKEEKEEKGKKMTVIYYGGGGFIDDKYLLRKSQPTMHFSPPSTTSAPNVEDTPMPSPPQASPTAIPSKSKSKQPALSDPSTSTSPSAKSKGKQKAIETEEPTPSPKEEIKEVVRVEEELEYGETFEEEDMDYDWF